MRVKNQSKSLAWKRYHINKFFNNLVSRGGFVNGRAVLLVKNDEQPELSYIVTGDL